MGEIAKVASGTSENMLLVMASLMLQDELNATNAKLSRAKKSQSGPNLFSQSDDIDEAVSHAIMTIADHIDDLADKFEAA